MKKKIIISATVLAGFVIMFIAGFALGNRWTFSWTMGLLRGEVSGNLISLTQYLRMTREGDIDKAIDAMEKRLDSGVSTLPQNLPWEELDEDAKWALHTWKVYRLNYPPAKASLEYLELMAYLPEEVDRSMTCAAKLQKDQTYEEYAAEYVAAKRLQAKYDRIRDFIGEETFGPGGLKVLETAYLALKEKREAGEGGLVGVEDLWAHALQEGLHLFNHPDKLWGETSAEETADMIGQTTVGPWQMTTGNIRNVYGPRYGVDPAWSDAEIIDFCREHPDVQAKMIIDYIQLSYEAFGRRSPYAIQRYFWLKPFVAGEIGQAEGWSKSVLAKPPEGGTWEDLTPEAKRETGFYAKQILLGMPYTKGGLLFWLYVAGDEEGARETLGAWRDERRLAVKPDDREANEEDSNLSPAQKQRLPYERLEESAGLAIAPEEIRYVDHPEIQKALRAIALEIAGEATAPSKGESN